MSEFFSGLLSNDSRFGRMMTKIGIIIATNILFALMTIPIVTIGAGFSAMYHTIMRMLRSGGEINPFKEFWKGLKQNWKPATIVWVAGLLLAVFLYLEWYWCSQFGGFFLYIRYGIAAIGVLLLILLTYLFPVIAAFHGNIPEFIRYAAFFAFKKPLYLIVILFFQVFPYVLTYSDLQYMPLYGFIWITCGYALVALVISVLLLREFSPYLPKVDANGDPVPEEDDNEKDTENPEGSGGHEKSEKEILEEIKKLGF